MGTFCRTCQGFIGFVVLFQNDSLQIAEAKLNKSNIRRKMKKKTHTKEHKGTEAAKAGKSPNKTSLSTKQTNCLIQNLKRTERQRNRSTGTHKTTSCKQGKTGAFI